MEEPVIRKRINYLNEALAHTHSDEPKKYVFSLILFSILIENVSLFSQFAIILSFTRFKGLMKNISNIIAWTSVDEQVHANAGVYIINLIKKEHPDFFDDKTISEITKILKKSIETEKDILDWIFADGEIDSISKTNLLDQFQVILHQFLLPWAGIGFQALHKPVIPCFTNRGHGNFLVSLSVLSLLITHLTLGGCLERGCLKSFLMPLRIECLKNFSGRSTNKKRVPRTFKTPSDEMKRTGLDNE